MVIFSKYQILEAHFPINSINRINWEMWIHAIAELIINAKGEEKLLMLTLGPNKARSIGYELGIIERKGSTNGVKYLVTDLTKITLSQLYSIVESDEFYLGSTLLVLENLTDNKISDIIILYESELVKSGVECFRMHNDGTSFCWYNPSYAENSFTKMKILGTLNYS